jgi:hypothetical protein
MINMNPLIPLCFLGILIGIGIAFKPVALSAVEILCRKRKQMHEEAKVIRILIDNEWSTSELKEVWHIIHQFYRKYRFVPRCKAVTGGLHSYRLNRLSEIKPTTKYVSKKDVMSELSLTPMQAN